MDTQQITFNVPPGFALVAASRGYASAQSFIEAHPSEAFAALAEAVLEAENIDFMATLSPKVTGIDHKLIFTPLPGGQHGPRIKVCIDPPLRSTGVMATVPFDLVKRSEGPIPGPLEARVRTFIAGNRAVLMDYWLHPDEVSTDEFIAALKPI